MSRTRLAHLWQHHLDSRPRCTSIDPSFESIAEHGVKIFQLRAAALCGVFCVLVALLQTLLLHRLKR